MIEGFPDPESPMIRGPCKWEETKYPQIKNMTDRINTAYTWILTKKRKSSMIEMGL